jgi:hypothetical protein
MKVVLNNLPGKSLVLDLAPTDTFGELQAHTLQRGDHFRYKGKKINQKIML